MTEEERRRIKEWVEAWKRAGPILEEERREQIRKTDTMRDLALFDCDLRFLLRTARPKPTSGLVEQQALFARMRQ
jgi:hypothetical protein